MKLYQRLALICLSGWAMFAISGCEARSPEPTQAAQKADYDYYLLALSLAPAFCEDAVGNRRIPRQCRTLELADFKQSPLTLHGLWPNNRSGRHPFNCGTERRNGGMCSLSEVSLPPALTVRLDAAMPGRADCLDRHEWVKHGSCSGLSVADYFEQSVQLTERANRALGVALADHAGREVALDALRATLRQRDPALLESVSFDCRTPRSDSPARRKPMLREVRMYFQVLPDGRVGEPMNFREVGVKHFNSGCPGGRAYIDTP